MTGRRISYSLVALSILSTAFIRPSLHAQWIQTSGPGGGRVSCFLASGSTVYAGTSYAGVYRSTDGGSTWSPARAGLVSLAIRALLFTGPTLYAATSSGVHVSTDGGQYWNQFSTSFHDVSSLALSGSSLLAGVFNDGVYVSTDNGVSWQQTLTLYSVSCLTVSGANIYAGTNGAGAFLSTDNGQTWNSIRNGLTANGQGVCGILVQGGNIFACTADGVFLSTNNGTLWTKTSNGLPPGDVNALATNGSALFAGTFSQGVYISTDNGSIWSQANTGLPDLRIQTLAWNVNKLLVGLGSAGVYASTNNGATWSYSCDGMPNGPVLSLARSGTTLIAGGYSSGVFISTDDGNSWYPSNAGLTDPTVVSLLVSGQSVFAGTGNGVSRSTNGGVSWNAANAGMTGTTVNALASSPGGLFAGVGSGPGTTPGVWRSTDNGASWTQTNAGMGTSVCAYCLLVKGARLFVGTCVGIFVSTDNGNSWNSASAGLGGSPSVSSLLADSGGTIYAGVGKDVFKSTNDGASWAIIGAGISGYGTYTFAIAGANVFAGFMGGGVYCFTGGGPTWHQENSALGDLYVYALSVGGKYLFAGTSAFGVWRRFLYDMIVPEIPVPTAATNVKSISFTANWNAALGATTYKLDVATDSTFGSFVTGYSGLDAGLVTSYPVSGLAPLTRYFYRVRSTNGVGSSGSSNPIAVQTLQATPAKPTSRTASGVSAAGFTANWSPASGALTYRLDVATDIGFNSFVTGYRDLDVGPDSSHGVTGLTPATDYYYQVRGVNVSGPGPSSNPILVTTLANAPGAPTATLPTNVTTSGFTANWNAVSGATFYELDVAFDAAFTSYVSGYSSHNIGYATSYAVSGVPEATICFYRVRARNTGGPGPNSNAVQVTTLRSYSATYNVQTTLSFGSSNGALSDYRSTDYKLIGIPGNSGQPVSDFLGGVQGTNWEIYWDNGTQVAYPDYYVRLKTGDSHFTSAAGKAFWFLHLGDWVLGSRTVATAPLDTAGSVIVGLTPGAGFNLITNPFLYSIPWSRITAANGITDSITAWSPAGWARASSFDPYRGYLFFNGAGRSSLRIPLNATLPKGAVEKAPDPYSWRIDVVARCGEFRDETTSFGVSPDALKGMDCYEQRKPRHMSGIPDIFFRHREWDERFPEFATDIRDGGADIELWEMSVRSDERKPVEVVFRNVERLPAGLAACLIDESARSALDLRSGSTYAVHPLSQITVLKVAVGKPALIRELSARVVPSRYAILQNYPNPFNPRTTIPVDVPEGSSIELGIYDVLGRNVATVYKGTIPAGRHFFEWDGRSDGGVPAASGLYFARLSVRDGVTLVSKMTMVR